MYRRLSLFCALAIFSLLAVEVERRSSISDLSIGELASTFGGHPPFCYVNGTANCIAFPVGCAGANGPRCQRNAAGIWQCLNQFVAINPIMTSYAKHEAADSGKKNYTVWEPEPCWEELACDQCLQQPIGDPLCSQGAVVDWGGRVEPSTATGPSCGKVAKVGGGGAG